MFAPNQVSQVLALYNGNIIKGAGCPTSGLWHVPLTTNPNNPHQTNAITLRLPSKAPDRQHSPTPLFSLQECPPSNTL